jgi:cytochrome c2
VANKRPTRLEEESHRMFFFIVSQLLMLSTVWLLYQEFFSNLVLGGRRPWKDVQLSWFEVERARATKNFEAEKEWLETGTITSTSGEEVNLKSRREALRREIEELEGSIIRTAKRVEFERLKAELEKAEIAVTDQEVVVAFAKAYEDEMYYWYRHAKHAGHEYAEEQAKYEEKHENVVAEQKKYDQVVAKRDALLDQVTAIKKELDRKKKELADMEAGLATAQRAVDAAKDRWTGIEQIWNQSIDLVDRCHSCHYAYDKCGFTDPKEILHYTLEEKLNADDLRTRFCLTRPEIAAYLEAAEKVRDSWYEDEKLDYDDVKEMLLTVGAPEPKESLKSSPAPQKQITEPVLATAQKLGLKASDAEDLYRTHPHYWHLIRKHPSQDFGCTTCHYGQGRETKGTALNYLSAVLWKGKENLAPFNHSRTDHYWEQQILENKKNHTEASCFNCHKQNYELEYAPNFTRARKLVENIGCTGCHPLGPLDPKRKHGPSLTKVFNKANQDWIYEWIKHPKALRARTRMPNFWPNALRANGEPDLERNDCNVFDFEKGSPPTPAVWTNCYEQREREAAYIMAYLKEKNQAQEYPSMPGWASAEKGKQVFEDIGCRGCHNMQEWQQASHMPGSDDRDHAPNLSNIGDKVNAGWAYTWVKNPKSYWPETRMPMLRLSDEEAWNVAAFLTSEKSGRAPKMSAKAEKYLAEEGAAKKGERLITYYGCFGCHEITGFEGATRIGADLTLFGSKLPTKLDFGDVKEFTEDPHAQTWENWLVTKVQEPRIYTYERASTRMPKFDLSEQEVKDVVLFMKSQNEYAKGYPQGIKKNLNEEEMAVQRGAFLVDVYNCGGCHMIDDRGIDIEGDHQLDGGDIFRLYADTEDKFRTPPKLINEGAKVYPDWLFKFLKAPFKLRENFELRMPTFQFSDEEAADLVAYFSAKADAPYPYVEKKYDQLSAADRATSEQMFREAQCLNCHNLGGGSTDPKNVAPNLRLTYERLRYDWLFHWLKNPQEQAPGVGMPSFFFVQDEATGEMGTPLTEIAGGDWKRQIELLRAYVIELGRGAKVEQGSAEVAAPPPVVQEPKKKKGKKG